MSKFIPHKHYIHCAPKFDLLKCTKFLCALLVDLFTFCHCPHVHIETNELSNGRFVTYLMMLFVIDLCMMLLFRSL